MIARQLYVTALDHRDPGDRTVEHQPEQTSCPKGRSALNISRSTSLWCAAWLDLVRSAAQPDGPRGVSVRV